MCVVPHSGYAIDKVESVKEGLYTKRLPGFHDIMEYTARLDKLNLQSLEYQRLVVDLILTYKIIFGLTDNDLNVYFPCKALKMPVYTW